MALGALKLIGNQDKPQLDIEGSIKHYYDVENKELVFTFSGGGSKVPSDDSPGTTSVKKYLETDVTKTETGTTLNKKSLVKFKPKSPAFTYSTKNDITKFDNTGSFEIRIKIDGVVKEVSKLKKADTRKKK